MISERDRLLERREFIARDITELNEQVEAGEVDAETADELRAGYEEELAAVDAQLADLPVEKSRETQTVEDVTSSGRSPKRVLVGAGILIAAFSVILVMVVTSAKTTTPPANMPAASGDVETEFAQMEQVVADHPDVVGMRIALADLYFENERYSDALNQYLAVMDHDPTQEEASHTLGRIGWLAYITGQPDAAKEYLDQSLETDPSNAEAKLFLGIVDLYGLEDPDGAIPLLEEVLARNDLPPQLRQDVQTALDDAHSQTSGG